ncbi:MAG: lipid-A-disaccharide synthase [Pseudomonadota bacterium]
MSAPLHLSLIAGEASGDQLGATLMAGLTTLRPGTTFSGVGGPLMAAEGLDSLFPMQDLSVMGLAEVLPHLPRLIRRLGQATEHVLTTRPDALITIDAPDFSLRVTGRVKARQPSLPTIHYVAPSVWAWRPGRAARMARHIDHVLALLPFEPPYMTAAGMTCDFVGHPVAAWPQPDPAACDAFRAELGLGEGPLLLLAPGSRRGEIARMWPAFAEVVRRLRAGAPDLHVCVPVAPGVRSDLLTRLPALGPAIHTLLPEEGEGRKRLAFAAADAALVTSGTVALEMAAAGTPHVSCYRTGALTAAIVRRLLKIDTAHLVNLVLEERLVPECLQEDCTPEQILAALGPLLVAGPARVHQSDGFDRALQALGRGGEAPGLRAAHSVLRALG